MTQGAIPTFTSGQWREGVLPNWVSEIRDRLADYSADSAEHGRNVRLFMLRLLLNQPVATIVSSWAVYIVPAALECCLRDLCDPAVGVGYHYFVRDVVFTLCDSWAFYYVQSTINNDPQITALLSYLIKHAYSDVTNVLNENIKSIGALTRLLFTPREGPFISLRPVVSLLTVAAGPTGGANASQKVS